MTSLVGVTRLIRFNLRRDRVILPIWVLWLGVVPLITVSAFESLYPTQAMIDTAAKAFGGNPAFRALLGPVFASSIGGLVAWRASLVLVVVGVVASLGVIRHTRVEEETGRRELIGATVVGRHAPLVAALAVVTGGAVALGVLITAGLAAAGLDFTGSVGLGAQFALTGIVFAGVGAVAAQITDSAGGARAIALSTLGLAFVIRAAGDAGTGLSWLSWLSPIGWAMQVRPFGDERWWLIPVILAVGVGIIRVAVGLSVRRDVGSGLVAPRPGPAHASARLRGPIGLAWRVHRGLLVGWTAAFFVLGGIYGSVAEGVGDMLKENPEMAEIFARLGQGAGTLIDLYLSGVMSVLALIAAASAIQAAMRVRIEEELQRAEPILATAVSRSRWLGAHVIFTFLAPVAILTSGGLGVGITYAAVAGDAGQLPRAIGAALVNLPAVWALAAIAIMLFGVLPGLTAQAWSAFAAAAFISILGALLRLPGLIMNLSPFTHTPGLPAADLVLLPLVALTAITVGFVLGGFGGLARRDLT